jgi:glycosyltransferase involved in cell wall biosynthesis
MKVLIIATTFPRWKGDAQAPFVLDLAKELRAIGNEVIVLAPHHSGALKQESMEKIDVRRFVYFFPASLQRLSYGAGMLPNFKKSLLAKLQVPFFLVAESFALLRIIRKEKPDIINAHWLVPQGLVATFIKPFTKVPIVMTAHGSDVFSFRTGYKAKLLRFIAGKADALTVNSTATQSIVKNTYWQEAEIIPMGVDLTKFTGKPGSRRFLKEHGINGPLLLTVGRLIELKGFRHAIEAMPLIKQSYPKAKLVIVGDGPDEEMLKKLSIISGVNENVIFTGRVTPDKMPEIFAACDIYLCPSKEVKDGGTEALGVVLLEALATGKPVVAADSGGIPDIIKDNQTGLLVPQANNQALADGVIKLLSDKRLRNRLVKSGQAYVQSDFSWPGIAKRFNNLYESVRMS